MSETVISEMVNNTTISLIAGLLSYNRPRLQIYDFTN
jgi:hypothetical protein